MATDEAMPTHYDPAAAAARLIPLWAAAGVDRGDPEAPGPAFSMVIPPPNVTGSLHMGHALNNTLQDILARFHRMDGHNVVWIPGADHASIAVHWVLDRIFKKEGTSRQALGRDAFMARAWALKEEIAGTIFAQQRRLGISCDWSRTRFTLDPDLSRAVREAFVKLYEDGLIYRAERLVNWDPVSQTTVSDLEVVHEENVKGELYRFAYPLADGHGELVVATTRPETMLGDTAVAVHPEDPRHCHLIGQRLRHPLADRTLPIIGDPILVDPAFGTGAVKVTPAHDFNDHAVGQRHQLESISILSRDGTLNAACGPFAGLTVPAARAAVKDALEAKGLGRGSEPHRLNIGRSERSGAVLEPMLSTQWYVRARPLATPAAAAVTHGATRFFPEGWQNTYFSWLRDVRDWCISRQLWWGHRIPAWHCESCGGITVAREDPEACEHCGQATIRQDEDILDTWFSSALWPFSTMGWPDRTPDLARWYPTQTLVTGFDIIFFWVARMMMLGQHLTGQVPFRDIYIHALIRDAQGDKMSKTKGNVVDPLVMIDRYGADAFRFTLAMMAGPGRDARWDEARAGGMHRFCNKLWQALRFTHGHLAAAAAAGTPPQVPTRSVYDRWILGRLGAACAKIRAALTAYRFSDAAAGIYAFVWDDFCDWYLEIAKATLYAEVPDPAALQAVRATLQEVFGAICRLCHPMMPFLSETMWEQLPGTTGSVTAQRFPAAADYPDDQAAAEEVDFVAAVVGAVRRIRAEYRIAPKEQVAALVRAEPGQLAWLARHAPVIAGLARATLTPLTAAPPRLAATEIVAGAEVVLPLAGLIDVAVETARLTRDRDREVQEAARLTKQLGNEAFVARAPAEVVAEKREALVAAEARATALAAAIDRLAG